MAATARTRIKARILPRWPSNVQGGDLIEVERSGSTLTVGFTMDSLSAEAAPAAAFRLLGYDPASSAYRYVERDTLSGELSIALAQIGDMSANARAFNAAANDAAMRTALGLGSAALQDSTAFAPAVHNHTASQISDATAAGRAMLTAASAAAQTALLNVFAPGATGLAPASGGGTSNFLRADGSWAVPPGAGGGGAGAGVNMLINADFRVDQRGGSSTADDAYGHDRWYALTQTAAIAYSTILNQENGTPFMARLTQSQASAQRFGYAQIVEGTNCRHARGQGVALSARVRCSAATTLRYAILEWTGTGDSVTSDVVNDWTNGVFTAGNFFLGSNLTVTATGSTSLSGNTLTDIALTGTCGSSLNNLIVFLWTESAQAQNVTLDISKVKLEIGGAATAFAPDDYSTLLEKCQRYLRKFAVGTVGRTESTTLITLPFALDKPMRATPTGSLIGTIVVRDYTGAATRTANSPSLNAMVASADGGYMEIVASSWSPGNFAGAGSLGNLNCTAGAVLLSAEL